MTNAEKGLARLVLLTGLALGSVGLMSAQAYYPEDLWEDTDRVRLDESISVLIEETIQTKAPESWSDHSSVIRNNIGPAVQALQRFLTSRNTQERRAAIKLLAKIGGGITAPSLIQVVKQDAQVEIRLEALQALVGGNAIQRSARLLARVAAMDSEERSVLYARSVLRETDLGVPEIGSTFTEKGSRIHREPTLVPDSVDNRIKTIIDEAIEASTVRQRGGAVAISRPSASKAQRREVLSFGEFAVPKLAEMANSGYGFQWTLAQRFLLDIGGKEIVAPLAKVALEHHNSHRRYTALLTIVSGTNFIEIVKLVRNMSGDRHHSHLAHYAKEVLLDLENTDD